LIFGTVSTLYSKWELGKSRRISIVRGRSPLKPPHVSAALGTFPIPKNINQRISASSDQTFPGRTELGHDLHTWLLSDASIIPNQSREIWHSVHLLSDPVFFPGLRHRPFVSTLLPRVAAFERLFHAHSQPYTSSRYPHKP